MSGGGSLIEGKFDALLVLRTLMAAWSSRSCSNWHADNPALGQCSVTALVLNDRFGGEILKTHVDGVAHFYHSIEGRRVDLTGSQFQGRQIEYQDLVSSRYEAMTDTEPSRYRALAEAFAALSEVGRMPCRSSLASPAQPCPIHRKSDE